MSEVIHSEKLLSQLLSYDKALIRAFKEMGATKYISLTDIVKSFTYNGGDPGFFIDLFKRHISHFNRYGIIDVSTIPMVMAHLAGPMILLPSPDRRKEEMSTLVSTDPLVAFHKQCSTFEDQYGPGGTIDMLDPELRHIITAAPYTGKVNVPSLLDLCYNPDIPESDFIHNIYTMKFRAMMMILDRVSNLK